MLPLLPGERKPNDPFTQRRGTRQTSIASFVTLQSGMASGGNQKNIFSLKENQTNKECKRTQLDCLDDGLLSPLVTSAPADIQEAGHPRSPQISGCQGLEMSSLTMMSLTQPGVLMGTESKGPWILPLPNTWNALVCWTKERPRGKGKGFVNLRQTVQGWEATSDHRGVNAISPWTKLKWARGGLPRKTGRPLCIFRPIDLDPAVGKKHYW